MLKNINLRERALQITVSLHARKKHNPADEITLDIAQLICDAFNDCKPTEKNFAKVGFIIGKAWGERPTFKILAEACAQAELDRDQARLLMISIAEGAHKAWNDAVMNTARSSICQALNAAGYPSEGGGGRNARGNVVAIMSDVSKRKPSKKEIRAIIAKLEAML